MCAFTCSFLFSLPLVQITLNSFLSFHLINYFSHPFLAHILFLWPRLSLLDIISKRISSLEHTLFNLESDNLFSEPFKDFIFRRSFLNFFCFSSASSQYNLIRLRSIPSRRLLLLSIRAFLFHFRFLYQYSPQYPFSIVGNTYPISFILLNTFTLVFL